MSCLLYFCGNFRKIAKSKFFPALNLCTKSKRDTLKSAGNSKSTEGLKGRNEINHDYAQKIQYWVLAEQLNNLQSICDMYLWGRVWLGDVAVRAGVVVAVVGCGVHHHLC
jgi:hypothetical protein